MVWWLWRVYHQWGHLWSARSRVEAILSLWAALLMLQGSKGPWRCVPRPPATTRASLFMSLWKARWLWNVTSPQGPWITPPDRKWTSESNDPTWHPREKLECFSTFLLCTACDAGGLLCFFRRHSNCAVFYDYCIRSSTKSPYLFTVVYF